MSGRETNHHRFTPCISLPHTEVSSHTHRIQIIKVVSVFPKEIGVLNPHWNPKLWDYLEGWTLFSVFYLEGWTPSDFPIKENGLR